MTVSRRTARDVRNTLRGCKRAKPGGNLHLFHPKALNKNYQHRIGESVQGRDLVVEANFDPAASIRPANITLIIGGLHGDEKATVALVATFRERWAYELRTPLMLICVANPDGFVANSRYNANRVDLNRNCDSRWQADCPEPSGPHPWSEPESRAIRDLILAFEPAKIVSLHWGPRGDRRGRPAKHRPGAPDVERDDPGGTCAVPNPSCRARAGTAAGPGGILPGLVRTMVRLWAPLRGRASAFNDHAGAAIRSGSGGSAGSPPRRPPCAAACPVAGKPGHVPGGGPARRPSDADGGLPIPALASGARDIREKKCGSTARLAHSIFAAP